MTASRPGEEALFNAARQIDDGVARALYLREASGGDEALLRRVEALLAVNDTPDRLLDQPAAAAVPTAAFTPAFGDEVAVSPRELVGSMIGPYKLLQQIGEGGMGTVYMAEQTRPVQRKVALKVVKAGMDSRQVVARFEAERQALAIMDHVNIARVFDGGTTENGRPYFVMELVHGVPITKYCDDNHLTPRQRLELFVPVCQAIQHAHQKGIIHRDIKPSNVMVTLYDGKPVPKVIDFGVAKATEQKLTDRTLFTQYGSMVGTLEYMSPEQAEMSALGVDTRSDIYSLGVLMYELLTGTTPLSHKRLKEAGYAEILRMIKEEEPPRPSMRLSDSGEALASISARRHTEPTKLTKLFRGEVDWIVMKALEKDRNRRYESANGFAADVQRYLNDETVQACPPSAGYRVRKFGRRNKRALVTASVIGVALLLAVGSLGWFVRDREAGRVRTAGEVNQFLQRAESLYADNKLPEAAAEVQKARGVLEAGSGGEDLGRRVRQWHTDLDTAAKLEEIRLEAYDLEDRDRGYADYARVFRDYGIDVEALPTEEATARVAASRIRLDLALALGNWAGRLQFDPRPQDPARWQRLLAIARAADPDPAQLRLVGAVEARELRTLRELANGTDPGRMRTRTLAYLGDALRTAGDPEAAVAFLRRAQRQHPNDFSINSNLARCLGALKPPQLDEVIAFRRAALAVRPLSAGAHNNLGGALFNQGKLDEAVACYRRAVELDPKSASAYNNLGRALRDQGKLDEAIAACRTGIELDPQASAPHINLGNALKAQGKLPEAIACYRTAIELDPKSASAHNNLGNTLKAQGKLPGAIAAFEKAIELDPKVSARHTNLGLALFNQGKLDEAIACYRTAIDLDPKSASAHHNLGVVLFNQGKLDEAVAAYETAIEIDPKDADAHFALGDALHDLKRLAEAVTAYRRAIKLDPQASAHHVNLGNTLKAQGKLDEAVACYRRAVELDPKSAAAINNLGTVLKDQGKLPEAVAAFEKAIKLDPQASDPHNGLGTVLKAQGKVDEAIAAYRKAIELDPKHVYAHYNLGLALLDQKKLDEAIAAFRRTIELDPNYAAALRNLGSALTAQGKLPEALVAFEKVIGIDPKDASAHRNLGLALLDQKKPDQAIACFKKAIELDPKYVNAHNGLGSALYDQKKLDEAISSYRRAIELDPKHVYAHYNLGLALLDQKKLDEAIAAFRRTIELDPKDAVALRRLGRALAQKGWDMANPDPKRAVAASTEAVELTPQSASAWEYLGWVQYRAGNWRASIEALEKACAVQKGDGRGQWIVMSLAHAKLAAQTDLPDKARALHKLEARRRYEQADKQIDSLWPVRPGHEYGRAIWDFRAEARELMGATEGKK